MGQLFFDTVNSGESILRNKILPKKYSTLNLKLQTVMMNRSQAMLLPSKI